jgi:electron transfer flavoprotein beta subunit
MFYTLIIYETPAGADSSKKVSEEGFSVLVITRCTIKPQKWLYPHFNALLHYSTLCAIMGLCQSFQQEIIFMKIIVCMKQVPATSKVEIDPESGTLKRLGADTKTNPYDLFGLEIALRIRDEIGGTVTVLTMGPGQTQEMMRDAYAMGADQAVILSDKKFAGADVLATSYTLAQGIQLLGGTDLIICGKQTTDGDTAQVGPAIAEHLGLPHTAWVKEICSVDKEMIQVRQDLVSISQVSEMSYPCLITVDKDIAVPRLPSYRRKKATTDREIRIITFEELPDQDMSRYGLVGSPTQVEKIFAPPASEHQVFLEGTAEEKTDQLINLLSAKKLI